MEETKWDMASQQMIQLGKYIMRELWPGWTHYGLWRGQDLPAPGNGSFPIGLIEKGFREFDEASSLYSVSCGSLCHPGEQRTVKGDVFLVWLSSRRLQCPTLKANIRTIPDFLCWSLPSLLKWSACLSPLLFSLPKTPFHFSLRHLRGFL